MMWLFRAFCDEKVRADRDKLKADLATTETRRAAAVNNYARANEALAKCQRESQQAAHTSRHTYNVMKDRYEGLIDAIKDAHTAKTDELEGVIGDLKVQLERANEYVGELEETALTRDAELEQVSGRLADAEGRLALIDREEDMRDEVADKRYHDGLGDE